MQNNRRKKLTIKISDKTRNSLKILNLDYPFTYEELKNNYRLLLLKNHPDHNGNKEKTIKIIEAYNKVKNLAININKENQEKIIGEAEKDIFDFVENCNICNGTGNKIIRQQNCLCINGYILIYCKACNATGKFKQKRGKIVNCFKCNGTGRFKKTCNICNGIGYIKETETYCFKCNGTGKIKLDPFNPVIPKGAIL
jgi:DnaJ-class molecular chaperone